MGLLKAIYIGSLRFNECPIFEFNSETKKFHNTKMYELSYPFEEVMNDDDFIVFVTDGVSVFQIEVKNKTLDIR